MFALDNKLAFVDQVGLHGQGRVEMVSMGKLQNKQSPSSLIRTYKHGWPSFVVVLVERI